MAQSPFETMTPESLKNEMLARVKEKGVDIDAREGSYANVLLSEAAYVMWKYGQTLNGFMSIIFPDASSGEYRTLEINGRYIRGFGVPKYPAEKRTLVRGDKGAAVGKLQELLNACGYELDVDNSFGPATQKAWGEYIAAYILKALK